MSTVAHAVRAKPAPELRRSRAPQAMVSGTPRYLRASLLLGGQNDPAEREAERAAGAIAAGGTHKVADPGGAAHLRAASEPAILDPGAAGRIRRMSGTQGGGAAAAADSIDRARGENAQALPTQVRWRLEHAFGQRMANVRVHTGPAADAAAGAIGARAYTEGERITLGAGESPHDLHLMAHEATHVVQNRMQSMPVGTRRIAAATGGEPADTASVVVDRIDPARSAEGWAIDLTGAGDGIAGTITVPQLELPMVGSALKGEDPKIAAPASGRSLPVSGKSFTLDPTTPRTAGKVFEAWVAYARTSFSEGIRPVIEARIAAQKATPLQRNGQNVYVLYGGGKTAEKADTMLVGTTKDLSEHDSMVRPMLGPRGGAALLDADHAMELQLGGLDGPNNLWLLDRDFNREAGPAIQGKIKVSINAALKAAQTRLVEMKAKPAKPLPEDSLAALRSWSVVFSKVVAGRGFGTTQTFWTRDQIKSGAQVQYFGAMTSAQLVKQGFAFKDGVVPKQVNVFPSARGGRVIRCDVSPNGKKLLKPSFFYRGFTILGDAEYAVPTADSKNKVMATFRVRRTKPAKKGSEIIVFADADLKVQHDEALGFGGYITDDSRTAAFKGASFKPLCPIDFDNVDISPEGDFVATGAILSDVALFPGLRVPIVLRGEDIFVSFPIPAEKLQFGPVRVSGAALDMGVGANGFFIRGSARLAIDKLGSGVVTARGEDEGVTVAGIFDLDLDFLEKPQLGLAYVLATDTLTGSAELKVRKGALPGVESGAVHAHASRDSFDLQGTLAMGGVLAGSTISLGYGPETGLLIEGRNLPLPLSKLPGISDATVSVRALRNPAGIWAISGGGKVAVSAGGATGMLDILFDGPAVTLHGRAGVEKGPAHGWLDITATNRAVDPDGKLIEGGALGALKVWGKGEATIIFGKILRGAAGLTYTPGGRVIVDGEIALASQYELFRKLCYSKTLLALHPPDFPIWGVEIGPVGFGIFAFVDASVTFNAWVGPGVLQNARLHATIDLDQPDAAQVDGAARFFVPGFAGFTLDLGGGLKAKVAVAYVKGRVGLDGTLGAALDSALDVEVHWNRAEGFAVGGKASVNASPSFTLGVNASIEAGVDLGLFDLTKSWGPWRKDLGSFGPNLALKVSFPVNWSENRGLDLSLSDITVQKPDLDAGELMKSAFKTLV